jgi:hypothetical protein
MDFESQQSTPHPALSIRQPWAELIMLGRKSIEVREWWTEYRGLLWIHAAKMEDAELDRRFGFTTLYRGGFIGQINLTSVVRFDRERWMRWQERHLSEGPMPATAYGWVLRDPIRLLQPYPARGLPGLFHAAPEVSQSLHGLLPLK